MIPLLEDIIKEEVLKLNLKEKMTSVLVKKKHRGTFQALQECEEKEKEIIDDINTYIQAWFIDCLLSGDIRKSLQKEIKGQVFTELSRKGFSEIITTIPF